jgi:soluble lytic murein transglycosylase-like protein
MFVRLSKLQKIPKIAIIISTACLAVITIVGILKSFKTEKTSIEKKSDNPEAVISPLERKETDEIFDYSGYFSRVTNEPAAIFENMVYNWQNLFDIFVSNPENRYLKYTVSSSSLEIISENVKKAQRFFKGNSDEIIAEYGNVIKEESKYYKLDWRLILAMIKQESAFVSDAESRAGAYGFMQIMPKTGEKLETTLNLEEHRSPSNNLIAGIYYYALLVGRYNDAGDTNKYKYALAAYNAGSGHVEDAMTIAYYLGWDYWDWDKVKETIQMLGPENDSLHIKIWGSKPPNGLFTNWKEPVNYVSSIMFYWKEYRKLYKP